MYGLLTQNYSLSKRHITMHSDNVIRKSAKTKNKNKRLLDYDRVERCNLLFDIL